MEEVLRDQSIHINMNISPELIIEVVNNKCIHNLGHPVINTMFTTVHHKVMVKFLDGKVMNFANYKSTLDYLNVAFNLQLDYIPKLEKHIPLEKESAKLEENIEDISIISQAVIKLLKIIQSFKETNYSIKLNKIILANYLESVEWKRNEFTVQDNYEVIDKVKKEKNSANKIYIEYIVKCLKENI